MMYTQDRLYDEVHAIMGKEFLTFFKAHGSGFESEVPYNSYGSRGSVDFAHYFTVDVLRTPFPSLAIYELESRIPRLEELIRKLKDRMEYFPSCFGKSRGVKTPTCVHLFLVLLATQDNLRTVTEYLPNLVSAFARTHQVYPADLLGETTDPDDPGFYGRTSRAYMVFLDPLKVRTLETNEGLVISDEAVTPHRLRAFQCLRIRHWEELGELRSSLGEVRPRFSDAGQFLRAYREYLSH